MASAYFIRASAASFRSEISHLGFAKLKLG
jgi:hypothetical protein